MKNFTKKMLNYTKICLLFLGFMFSGNTLLAQKVAVVGTDHSGVAGSGNYDGFSFVATQALTAGDIIYFTNNYYNAATTRFRVSTDGLPNANGDNTNKFIAKYVVPAGGLAKGIVVYLRETDNTSNVLGATCSSGSCGTVSLISFNGLPIDFRLNSIGVSVWAYSDTDDDPLNGITTIHGVLFGGVNENFADTFGNVPAAMNPIGNFPAAIIVDGLLSAAPTTFTTIEFKPGSRAGAVSKLNLEDPTNYDVHVSTATSLSTTAFANLNLVNTNPTVGVAVSPSSVTENGATNFTYTFTLSANAASNITVNYTASGTATNGTDYGSLTGTVVIAEW